MLGELSNYPNRSPLKEMSIHRRQQVLHQEIGILGYGTKKYWKRSHSSIKTSFFHPTLCSLELFTCQPKMLSHFFFYFFFSLYSLSRQQPWRSVIFVPFFPLAHCLPINLPLVCRHDIFSRELEREKKKNNLSLNGPHTHVYFFQSSSSAQYFCIRELPAVNCCVYKTSCWFLWPAQCVEAFRMCSVYTVFRTFAHQRVCIAPQHCTHTQRLIHNIGIE